MRNSLAGFGIGCSLFALTFSGSARADFITDDTYIDSYNGTSAGVPTNENVNYGGSAAIKVVVSAGSDQYPDATSTVRTYFDIKPSLAALGNSPVSSASVTFRVRNNNNNLPFTRVVGLYPATHAFTVGTGHQPNDPNNPSGPPSTMGGTTNLPGAAVGADWNTYNGIYNQDGSPAGTWTPGGDFDSAAGDFVTGAFSTVGGNTYMTWNITDLLNNPTTRAEIVNDGMVVRIIDDTNFPAINTQQFLSFYSSEGAPNDASRPTFIFTLVPEPAGLGLIAVASTLLLNRRRRMA